jgi:transcriptional regulator with XRE-family HTH domain
MKDQLIKKSKAVAGNIRKIREFRNYTQDYLAAKIGISQNAYSKIELGYSKITLDRLFHIAIILDVEATQLISADPADLMHIISQSETLKESSSA